MAAFGLLVLGGGVWGILFRQDLAELQLRLLFAGRGRDTDIRILLMLDLAAGVTLVGVGLIFLIVGAASGLWLS